MKEGVSWQARHYLYGGSPETIAALLRRLPQQAPGVDIVGAESPPYRDLLPNEELALTARVFATRPDYVWVGLGTPKQDEFVDRWAGVLPAVFVGVGAAFDFIAGTKQEAPAWLHGSGLEWVYRLAAEPRRLWKRYLIGNTRFLLAQLRDLRH